MRLSCSQLIEGQHNACYLFGEDSDAMALAAETLLQQGDAALPRQRVDCSELNRIASAWGNPALFGPSGCIGLVRNAQSATPKQSAQLLAMLASIPQGSRIIICASGAMWKKALHKKLLAIKELACCEYTTATPAQFKRWLVDAASQQGVTLDQKSVEQASERLCGMQQAAQQWLQRLAWYSASDPQDGQQPLPWSVAGALLGEQAPAELDAWCHAVASKSAHALTLQRRLVEDQHLSPVQMIHWLGTRMQQIVLYRWHQAQHTGDPIRAAKLFGDARKQVPKEAGCWSGTEINALLTRISQAEQQLKGASIEADHIVLARLVREIIA